MLKDVIGYGKQLFTLVRDTQQNTADIKELREQVDDLAHAVERLATRIEYDQDLAARDRENLVLRLELTLERFERRLPPPRGDQSAA